MMMSLRASNLPPHSRWTCGSVFAACWCILITIIVVVAVQIHFHSCTICMMSSYGVMMTQVLMAICVSTVVLAAALFQHWRMSNLSNVNPTLWQARGRGWQFNSWLWNLLSTWQKNCQVVNCSLCFGASMSTFCRSKSKSKIEKNKNKNCDKQIL